MGERYQYVVDDLLLPTTASQANEFGINLDGDEQNRPDNALGSILSTLASQSDADLQAAVDENIQDGGIILLADVQTTGFMTASRVGLTVFLGDNPGTEPCTNPDDPATCGNHLDGATTFDIASDSPQDALLAGQIVGGQFTGGPGTVTIELSLVEGGAPLRLNLIGSRAEIASTSETALTSGKLGGAITEEDLNNNVLPALVDIIADTTAGDCPNATPPCCDEGSTGQTLMDLFDEDGSCDVDLEELQNNSLISSLLAPDVDLLDADGNYAPLEDGVKDSLSLGVGFSATGAVFTPPPR